MPFNKTVYREEIVSDDGYHLLSTVKRGICHGMSRCEYFLSSTTKMPSNRGNFKLKFTQVKKKQSRNNGG